MSDAPFVNRATLSAFARSVLETLGADFAKRGVEHESRAVPAVADPSDVEAWERCGRLLRANDPAAYRELHFVVLAMAALTVIPEQN